MTKTAPLIDIRPDHWDIVQGILQKHVPQYEVWAFGSRAKWTAKQYSDLDLALITDKPLSLDVSASLSDDWFLSACRDSVSSWAIHPAKALVRCPSESSPELPCCRIALA